MSRLYSFVGSVPRGLGDLLARELQEQGAMDVRERGNTVAFTGTLEVAYRACLESRVASRILLELQRFEAAERFIETPRRDDDVGPAVGQVLELRREVVGTRLKIDLVRRPRKIPDDETERRERLLERCLEISFRLCPIQQGVPHQCDPVAFLERQRQCGGGRSGLIGERRRGRVDAVGKERRIRT